MRVTDFHFELPEEQIAQAPLDERSASRLLVIDGTEDRLDDRAFRDLPSLLNPGDLLVFNDTRVIAARLDGVKADTGGRVEVLVERIEANGCSALCHVRASKSPPPGTRLALADGALEALVRARQGELYLLDFGSGPPLVERLEKWGRIPLPPYIDREDNAADRVRYQTIHAREPGAVAAPTAGLHFDQALMSALADRGIHTAQVTLHVGAGTFQPVRTERIEDHHMHAERVAVSAAVCDAVAAARARGGRVIAVGTTVVRSLESAAAGNGRVQPFHGETRLYIKPGDRFRVADGMITNFHLPGSTLLMLVCAYGGHQRVMAAYRHAVAVGYRFFSYGDACLLWPEPGVREQ